MASLLRTGALRAPRTVAVAGAASASSSGTRSVLRSSSALLHTTRAALSEKDPQLGDYPDVPYQSRQLRKWSPTWWDGQDKMNFGETLNEQEDVLSVWAPDLHENTRPSSALFQVLVAAGIIGVFSTIVYTMQPHMPANRRTYPRGGLAEELGGPQAAARTSEEGESGEEEEEEGEDEE